MNIHAIKDHKRATRIVQRVVEKDITPYDGKIVDSHTTAENIVVSLKRNKLMKTYRS